MQGCIIDVDVLHGSIFFEQAEPLQNLRVRWPGTMLPQGFQLALHQVQGGHHSARQVRGGKASTWRRMLQSMGTTLWGVGLWPGFSGERHTVAQRPWGSMSRKPAAVFKCRAVSERRSSPLRVAGATTQIIPDQVTAMIPLEGVADCTGAARCSKSCTSCHCTSPDTKMADVVHLGDWPAAHTAEKNTVKAVDGGSYC